MARSLWIGAVVAATAAACSSSSSPEGGGLADGGDDATFGQDATGDMPEAPEASSDGSPDVVEAASHSDGGTDASMPTEAGSEGGSEAGSDAGPEAASEASAEGSVEAATEASVEASTEAAVESGAEAAVESGTEAGLEAGTEEAGVPEAGPEAGTEAGSDAGPEASTEAGIVAPTCDGVVSPGEYGGTANQGTSGSQTWLMTWDDSNLYIAIENANVQEGNVVYVAIAPGTDAGPSGALTQGQPYDNTDVTTLPFAASLVVYAHDGYSEARTPSGGSWNTQSTTAVQICDNATTNAREEVVPWSLVGGRPASFGWLGYLAASPGGNPQGYIYGQEPSDNPGGQPANNEAYTKYYAVPDATPGKDGAFSDEP